MFEMLNNPDIMDSIKNLMQNEDIQKMMQNKDFVNNLQNFQKSEEVQKNTASPQIIETKEQNLIGKFLVNETVITKNLKNEAYNNKVGVIQDFNKESRRYTVLFEDNNKLVSIKEDNIENNFDNIEVID